MEQLTFVAPGKVEWHDVPPPRLSAAGEALVRPLTVATCDLDVAIARGRWPVSGPFALGHEFVAEVRDVADDVDHVAVGDLVVVPFQISCGTCDRCLRGLTASCSAVPERSMYGLGQLGGQWGGAVSDLVRVPFADHMLMRLPSGVDPAVAASAGDNITDAWRAVAPPLERSPGGSVLVVGGGGATSIGLYAVAIAHALGASHIDYVDHDPDRLATASRLGASPVVASEPAQPGLYDGHFPYRLGPYSLTVDASAHPSGLALAMRSTEPGGTCTNTGVAFELTTPIPLLEAYGSGLTLVVGRAHVRADLPAVLDLIASRALRPELVTTEYVPWSAAAEVFADPPAKAVIVR